MMVHLDDLVIGLRYTYRISLCVSVRAIPETKEGRPALIVGNPFQKAGAHPWPPRLHRCSPSAAWLS